jgi:hypothetical protein
VSWFFIAVAAFYSFALWFGIDKAAQKGASVAIGAGDAAFILVIVLSLVAAWLGRARRS